jgi:hypothetical protein
MKTKIFETYRNLDNNYFVDQLKMNEPSCINFLSYRKYKVTIELIEEPKEVLIDRLNELAKGASFNRRQMIEPELKKLKV